jgi:hypothetical protein
MQKRNWTKAALLPVVLGIFQLITIGPAQAGCQNVQGNYGNTYLICRTGSYMTLQGSNYRTGSFWSESCWGVGRRFGSCQGRDARGNFWSCNWSPFEEKNCYKSELVN